MTIQQLNYILAVSKFRHFVSASEYCKVSQPTLSTMIQKLEAELDVEIFDRSKHPVEPTAMGLRIIKQAENALREFRRIAEMVEYETGKMEGRLNIGVIPTLASYLVPRLIQVFSKEYAAVDLSLTEMNTGPLIEALKEETIDLFIAATPLEDPDLLEIPIFYEKFLAYFSPGHPAIDIPLNPENMPRKNLWVLEEGHCLREQVFNFCQTKMPSSKVFEAGSIETLVRIVDINGGYTLIPELHLDFLTASQKNNIRDITDPPAIREVSIVITKNFIKERMINAVADSLKSVLPENMLDKRLKKFSIKL